jgi:hypothetical protein
MYNRMINFSCLIGETISEISGEVGDEEMIIKCQSGRTFKLYHQQDCCESVLIEDICGDFSDLIDTPVLSAEESSDSTNPDGVKREFQSDSYTWTFYRIVSVKGDVVIRWYGESNGYYSEAVNFEELFS